MRTTGYARPRSCCACTATASEQRAPTTHSWWRPRAASPRAAPTRRASSATVASRSSRRPSAHHRPPTACSSTRHGSSVTLSSSTARCPVLCSSRLGGKSGHNPHGGHHTPPAAQGVNGLQEPANRRVVRSSSTPHTTDRASFPAQAPVGRGGRGHRQGTLGGALRLRQRVGVGCERQRRVRVLLSGAPGTPDTPRARPVGDHRAGGHCMHAACTLYARRMHAACMPHARCMCTACAPHVHRMCMRMRMHM